MDSSCAIIVPDADILSKLCGTNDSNLKLIEESLGVQVYARGNELSVEDQDPDIQRRFKFIVDRIIDEIEDGAAASADASFASGSVTHCSRQVGAPSPLRVPILTMRV